MDRVAVFVDAGYLFAQGSAALAGRKLPRGGVVLDHETCVKTFIDFACKTSGLSLLRLYWYDGSSTGPTSAHLTLAHLSNVKMRLGYVNSVGEQKGVDSLIVTDMITLARNRSISDAILLSGDEDLRVGVQQAQEYGVRVHLLGIKPSRGSQSLFLLQESDTTHEWGPDELRPFLSLKNEPEEQPTPVPVLSTLPEEADVSLDKVAADLASTVGQTDLAALVESIQKTKLTPPDIDRLLLAKARTRLGGIPLTTDQKRTIREAFLAACRTRLGSP